MIFFPVPWKSGCRYSERNVLFNDAINTFYLRLYGVRHMVKDHSDSEKENSLPPQRLLLSINSKGSFICTDRITHTTAFVTPVVEHWLEREIAQWCSVFCVWISCLHIHSWSRGLFLLSSVEHGCLGGTHNRRKQNKATGSHFFNAEAMLFGREPSLWEKYILHRCNSWSESSGVGKEGRKDMFYLTTHSTVIWR